MIPIDIYKSQPEENIEGVIAMLSLVLQNCAINTLPRLHHHQN